MTKYLYRSHPDKQETRGSQQLFFFKILSCRAKGIPKNNILSYCMYEKLFRRDLVG